METLNNEKIILDVDVHTGQIVLKNSNNCNVWSSGRYPFIVHYFDRILEKELYSPVDSIYGWNVSVTIENTDVRVIKYHLENPHIQIQFSAEIQLHDCSIEIMIPKFGINESNPRFALSKMHVLPCFGSIETGADGYLVLPNDGGLMLKPATPDNSSPQEKPLVGMPCQHFKELFDPCGTGAFVFYSKVYSEQPSIEELPNMPLYGAIIQQSGYAAIITAGEFDAEIVYIRQADGMHSLHTAFTICSNSCMTPDNVDRSVRIKLLETKEANYSGIAKAYRKYLIEEKKIKTLRNRMKENPKLEKLSRSFINKVLLGLKSFSGYPQGSLWHSSQKDGHGNLNVFLTFDEVAELTKRFSKLGVKNAYLNITGFNTEGHDGCFPSLFPVEEAFGGEQGLKELIKTAKKCGYLIDAHINYRDGYAISEDWAESNVMQDEFGQLRSGLYGPGGLCYEMCPATVMDLMKRDIPRLREFDFTGPIYFDNIMGFLHTCHSSEHELNRRQYAEAIYAYLNYAREYEDMVATEMTISDMIGRVDLTMNLPFTRGAADLYRPASTLRKLNVCWEGIPLAQIVYHGLMLYTLSFSADEIIDDYLLYFIEAGSLPRFDWRDNNPSEKLEENVRAYQICCEELGHLQKEFILEHQKLADGIYRIDYENGQALIVNYTDESYQADAQVISAKSYALLNVV